MMAVSAMPALGQPAERAPAVDSAATRQAALALIRRVVPSHAADFEVTVIPPAGQNDVFEIQSDGGRIVLRGNNGVSIASALNRYLEEFGHCEISWDCGDQLSLPASLPSVPSKIRVVSPHRFIYAYNYCTHGYTMAWWDWPKWQRELDFLALKGVNLVLVIEGQEQVWIETLRAFGYSDADVRRWLVMPSHQPWEFMSNLEDFGGPEPAVTVEKRLALGRKIVARMRELGIEPVLQGYYGIVPSDFKNRFPGAKVHSQGDWGGLKRPDMLDPLNPLFPKFAAAFYQAQARLLGQARFFAADPFHEGGNMEGIDLGACSRAIFGAMDKSNPGATWVLQSWLENPRPPMIDALDKSRLLVLDLFCEDHENWRLRNQFGHTPWLWCTIQNWGGNIGLGGDLEGLRVKPAKALAEAGPGKGEMRGIGALMEGSQTQPLLWELFFRNAWYRDPPKLKPWLLDYAKRRYGVASPAALQALQIEVETVYTHGGYVESVICARPSLDPYPKARFWGSTKPAYDTTRLARGWGQMLDAAAECQSSDGYRYDLTDLGRQVLADLAGRYHRAILQAYARRDAAAANRLSEQMLGLIRDLDTLLATRQEFLLGVWLDDARRYGATKNEQDLCERNARELLTTWAGEEVDNIPKSTDYANRQWAGLVGTFYYSRWQIWLTAMQSALVAGGAIDTKATQRHVRDVELEWTRRHERFPAAPQGDTLEISRRLWVKYSADATNPTLGASAARPISD
jgi:alpha-N-acetylglucosaminidase